MTATGRPITLQTSAVAGLAVLVVIATLCTSLALLAPRAAFSSLIADLLKIAPPKAYRADRALARGDLISAAAETRAELQSRPFVRTPGCDWRPSILPRITG